MENDLLRWRKESSPEDCARLAKLANTSVGHLNLIAYGFRRASPNKAYEIEAATTQINKYAPVTKESLVFAPARVTAA